MHQDPEVGEDSGSWDSGQTDLDQAVFGGRGGRWPPDEAPLQQWRQHFTSVGVRSTSSFDESFHADIVIGAPENTSSSSSRNARQARKLQGWKEGRKRRRREWPHEWNRGSLEKTRPREPGQQGLLEERAPKRDSDESMRRRTVRCTESGVKCLCVCCGVWHERSTNIDGGSIKLTRNREDQEYSFSDLCFVSTVD